MGDFQIGSIKVIDNGDGVYQLPVKGAKSQQDEIVDDQGQTVKATGKAAQAALKELGITSLVGLKLSPASQYLSALADARNFAAKGDTYQTQESLRKARIAATEAKLPFRESEATTILETSLTKEVTLLGDRAQTLADAGDVTALGDVFNAAREIYSRLQIPLDKAKDKGFPLYPESMEKFDAQACTVAIPKLFKDADSTSQAGNVPRTLSTLQKIQDYTKRAKLTLSADQTQKISDLTKQAYQNSVDALIVEAASLASLGDLDKTRQYLQKARDAAKIGGVSLSKKQETRIQQIETLALSNAPDFLLKQADTKADQGKVSETRDLVQAARDILAEQGRKFSKTQEATAETTLTKALRLSVDVLLKDASKAVSQVGQDGNISKIKAIIQQARENAAEAGLTFSTAQETSAQSILDQSYDAAIAWRFRTATSAADLGKVDDTIVPLNAARELAKQGSRTFDEAAAKALIDRALTQGIDLELKAAEGFAKSGDKDNTFLHLDNARDYWRRLGKSADEKRIGKIVKLLPNP